MHKFPYALKSNHTIILEPGRINLNFVPEIMTHPLLVYFITRIQDPMRGLKINN
jgi:hypothetical protein